MRRLVTSLTLMATVLMSGGASARAGGVEVVSEMRASSFVSAYGGTVAWSSYDEGSARFWLTALHDGRVQRLGAASLDRPFDVDLGPGRDGAVRAVYSRCREPQAREHPDRAPLALPYYEPGCHIWVYDFRTGRERRIENLSRRGSAEFSPTIWRDGIAFVRRRPGPRVSNRLSLIVKRGDRRARRVHGGTRARQGLPTRLDLRGDRLAFSWSHDSLKCAAFDYQTASGQVTELWIARAGRSRERVAAGCEWDSALSFDSASLAPGALFSLMKRRFRPRGAPRELRPRISRISLTGEPTQEYDLPPEAGSPVAFTQDGSDSYVLVFTGTTDRPAYTLFRIRR